MEEELEDRGRPSLKRKRPGREPVGYLGWSRTYLWEHEASKRLRLEAFEREAREREAREREERELEERRREEREREEREREAWELWNSHCEACRREAREREAREREARRREARERKAREREERRREARERKAREREERRREARERKAREREAREREAREREERRRENLKQLKGKWNVSRGDHITYRKNGNQQRALVQNVDYRAETLTITEFSNGKLQRKTLEFSAEKENYLTSLPGWELTFTGFLTVILSQRSRNEGHVEQSLSQNTQSFKDPHAIDTMCNLSSNSCEHCECNCESQSQIYNRTTYDKYNRPIGPKKPLDQLQSENTHEQNETVQPLYHVSHHEPPVSSNSDSHEIQSRRTPNQITNRRRYDNYNRPIEPSYQSDTQRKQNEKDKLQIMHCKPETRHQIPGCDQGQIPNRTSKTLVATLCLQSSISKFNVNNLSKEEPPRAVLPSRAVLLASFITAAMLPYIPLLVSNLTSVQRTYAGLWRPNELCNY